MKKTTRKVLVASAIIFNFFTHSLFARNGTSVITGNWNGSSTWLINGSNSQPANGDTLYIRPTDTVTVTSTVTYVGLPIVITVAGTLQFQTGKKLTLPCGSYVSISPGGRLLPGTGGGNADYIDICGSIEWSSSDGPLYGPVTVGTPPLPITLASFTAKIANEQTEISWTTATEINNDYFIVQKSRDGIQYEFLDKVKGVGNSTSMHYYTVTDENPSVGINYYRLCQFDYDGTRTDYAPCAVRTKGKDDILLYPNPATKENIFVYFDGSETTSSEIVIYDIAGKMINDDTIILSPGANKLHLDDYLFKPGIYFFSIIWNEKTYQQKAIIR
jgi:hypothetical protein